jgi:hypothetical protein
MSQSSFYKDSDGLMRCKECMDFVCWMQNNAGKWYLGNASRNVENVSGRYEEKWNAVSVPSKIKVPHFATCRKDSPKKEGE